MRSHHRTAALLNMVLSCVICSIAVNWIALPNGFVVTGITGLAMTAETFTGINYALIYYGLTLAILLFTAVTLGYKEVSSILFLSILYPLVLWVLNHVQVEIILKEKLIAVMFFGVVYGAGAGLTYRMGYSYGGTDTLSKILKQKVFKAAELKNLLLCLDAVIMLIMLSAFSLDTVAYAFVGQIIYVNSMNYVIFNMGPRLYEIQIVCEDPRAIERFIIEEIGKSATISKVIGGYSQADKIQLDCVCNSREYVQLREFIRDSGIDCFIKVFPLTHVFGRSKDFHRLSDQNLCPAFFSPLPKRRFSFSLFCGTMLLRPSGAGLLTFRRETMEQELFLPTLMHWQYGNNWCGSLKRASFWITPKDEQLTAQLWTGPAIRENAEILYTAQFPISDEGLEQLRTWLLEHAAAVNAANPESFRYAW